MLPIETETLRAARPFFGQRPLRLVRFALWRFIAHAHEHMNAAAQDKAGRFYGPGAVDAFARDAQDAEAILRALAAPGEAIWPAGKDEPAMAARAPRMRLWLWKNFVDGRPEFWAFDNAYPINLENGDPQTLGEPCGYAIFKPSRAARVVSDEEVLQRIAAVSERRDG